MDQQLRLWQSKTQAWQELLQRVFGRSAPLELRAISLEILDSQTMAGLRGAYTASDPNGEERIYLNSAWLKTATVPELEAVLLEEIGHAIDHHLNGNHDTAGDEGAIFSSLIKNKQINPSEFNQNDHSELLVSGRKVKIEASSITTPTAVASITDGGTDGNGNTFDVLNGPYSVTTVVIGGSTYALVASMWDNGLQIVDISTPAAPTAVASFTLDEGGFDELDGAASVTTVVIGGSTYALVASVSDDGLQVVDISTPAAPTAVASITDGGTDDDGNTFDELTGAISVTTVVIGGSTYALVASLFNGGLQIVDISTPAAPTAVASITDGGTDGDGNTFDELDGAKSVTTVVIGGSTYALVAARHDNGLQIIDISTPGTPTAVASITDDGTDGDGNTFDELDGPFSVTTVAIGGSTYALVASYDDNGLQIVDISTPATPTAVASITDDGTDGDGNTFDELDGPFSVTTVAIGGSTYALVASYDDNGLQIVDISTPATPTAVASITDDGTDGDGNTFDELDGPFSVTTVAIGGSTYALVASYDDNGLQIVDISNPATPTAVASITDGVTDGNGNTFDEFDGASSVTTVVIGGSTYALAASLLNDRLQVVNINTAPTLTSATYNASSSTLVVTGSNLVTNAGANNDIDISKLTLTGEGNSTYTLTTGDVENTSATAFSVILNAADQLQLAGLLNKNGTSSGGGTTYNIAAASGWNPGAASSPADSSGNAITVSNVATPTLSSATYNNSTGVLTL
ncbi:hypothetical protein, partial [Synechococcus sp. UW140]|uniref:hypothetical protein n=1 Tax=Synechococcus sp. UW140 TaxID=368503 RepID=UPI0018E0794B